MRLPNLRDGAWASPNGRRLLVVSIIDSTGNGAFTSASVVLFSVVLHLTPAQIGRGLTLGAFLGLFSSVLWGTLADRLGVRTILLSIQLWRAAAFIGYAFIHDFTGYVAIAVFLGLAERASPPILLSFVTSAVGESNRVKTAGALRSIRNAGFTLGALLASLALLSPGRTSLLCVVLGNAASFIVAAALLRGIVLQGPPKPVRKPKGEAPDRVRSRPAFLIAAVLTGVLSMHRFILSIGLPLWIVSRHLVPKPMVSVLIAINTVLVVFLQVRMTRQTDAADGAARALRNSGWMLLCCALLLVAASGHLPIAPWTAGAILVVAILALTFAEMWQAAGTWGLSLRLSPEASRTRFLSVFNLGTSFLDVAGPFVVTALVLPAGRVGWAVLGGVLAVAGLLSPVVARWAERERLRHEEPVAAVETHTTL
ncbi:MFS transporter [Actinoallomurus purpureus]|uniref:MFS transporter n=1 Tax=Actinoallomurus purpureus TaxID=478114 RepID=UPI0020933824|nr:MFS transporter [Actinoallomurus purpureus]MCO6005453.1 MFS transporter [Actinoallomurus purpureus]